MSDIKMNIWNREFNLEVYFKTYADSSPTECQEETYKKFIHAKDSIEKSKEEIITYIEQSYCEQLSEKIVNIFKYVIPKIIYIPKIEEKRQVALLCDFKFDIEHGLAVLFENEKFKEVLLQDGIL